MLPPILEIAQFIATLREMPFASDAMIGLRLGEMIALAGFRVLAHACGETPGDAAATPESWCLYLISATARRKDGRAPAPPPGFLPRTVAVLLRVAYLGLASASSASAAPTARPRTFWQSRLLRRRN